MLSPRKLAFLKYNSNHIMDLFAYVLELYPELPFPIKEYNDIKQSLGKTKNYRDYLPLLFLRMRRGEDQKDDYDDLNLFALHQVMAEKCQPNVEFNDPIIQHCVAQARKYFASKTSSDFASEKLLNFLASVARIKISADDYLDLCKYFFEIISTNRLMYAFDFQWFREKLRVIVLSISPALMSPHLSDLIVQYAKDRVGQKELSEEGKLFLSLIKENTENFSLEQSKQYLTKVLATWIGTSRVLTQLEDIIWDHHTSWQCIDKLSSSPYWDKLCEYMFEVLTQEGLDYLSNEISSETNIDLRAAPIDFLTKFNSIMAYLMLKEYSEQKILECEIKLLDSMRQLDQNSTNHAVKHAGSFESVESPIEYAFECLANENGSDYTKNIPSLYFSRNPIRLHWEIDTKYLGDNSAGNRVLPLGMSMYLAFARECEPHLLLDECRDFGSRDLLYLDANNLFYLFVIMGIYTFKFLSEFEKSISTRGLAEFLSDKNLIGNHHTLLKQSFEKNRKNILGEESWAFLGGLPTGMIKYLAFACECKPKSLLRAYLNFSSKYILFRHADNLFYLFLIMGLDTFQFLAEFEKATSESRMSYFLKCLELTQLEIAPLKSIFQRHRSEIFNKRQWHLLFDMFDHRKHQIVQLDIQSFEDLDQLHFHFLLNSKILWHVPFDTYGLLGSSLYGEAIRDLEARFKRVNAQIENERNICTFNDFMCRHSHSISFFSRIFGLDTFKILTRYLTTSLLPLQQLLQDRPIATDRMTEAFIRLYQKHKENILNNNQHAEFVSCVHLLSARELFKDHEWIYNAPNEFHTLDALSQRISAELISCYLAEIGHEGVKIDYAQAFERLSFDSFFKLVRARATLSDSIYLPVFDCFLCGDLAGEKLDNKKADDIFRQLEAHNQKIRQELSDCNITLEAAMHYPVKYDFSCGGASDKTDEVQLIKALWIDLNQLRKRSVELENNGITGPLDGLQNSLVKKNENAQGNPLTDAQAKEVFRKLKTMSKEQKKSRLEPLINELKPIILKSNDGILKEFFGHLEREAEGFQSLLKTHEGPAQYLSRKYFSIEMFDKSSPDAFLLGDYVGCCLATNGGQFSAMVQRRMDDAMFMHVVRDKAKNQAVALNWLFFAKDKNNPKHIYVVANYFEITGSLGYKPGYRDAIIDELKEFTGAYAQAIGAKGFLIRHLIYGLIPNFKGYEQIEIELEKIGGFLSLDNSTDSYYLLSLQEKSFHLFEPKKPSSSQSLLLLSSSGASKYQMTNKSANHVSKFF